MITRMKTLLGHEEELASYELEAKHDGEVLQ